MLWENRPQEEEKGLSWLLPVQFKVPQQNTLNMLLKYAHFVFLCHVLIIHTLFQIFSSLLHLLR